MTTELKPCPFCGERVASVAREGGTYWVRCGYAFCRATGSPKSTLALAKIAWNQTHRRDDVPVAIAVEQETLHDKYTMAAMATSGSRFEFRSPEDVVEHCRNIADAAMKARGT